MKCSIRTNRHRVRCRMLILCVVAASSAGCTLYEETAVEVTDAVDRWERRPAPLPDTTTAPAAPVGPTTTDGRPTTGVPVAGEPPAITADGHPVDASVPTNEVLAAYIREALARNPSIGAAIADVEATLERIPQVVSLPDPFIQTIARPEPIQTAAGDMYFTLGIGQTIPMPAKLDRAGRAAVAEVRMAIERLSSTRLQVIADVERAYNNLYLADRYLELSSENRRLLENLEQVVNAQYEVGKASQEDLLRTQTELLKVRDEEDRYKLQRASAAAALNQLCDHPPTRPLMPTEALTVARLAFQADHLTAIAEATNPDLALLRWRLERDEHRLASADLRYWPDVTLGLEWTYTDPRDAFRPPNAPLFSARRPYSRKSEAGDDIWAVTVRFNVPLWIDRNESARREARMRIRETEQAIRASRNMIAFRIYDAWTRVEAEQDTVHLLETALIPQAQQTYEVALMAYQAGDSTFPSVVDNWRRWLDFERLRHRSLVDLANALSSLQREVGLQLIETTHAPAAAQRGIHDEGK